MATNIRSVTLFLAFTLLLEPTTSSTLTAKASELALPKNPSFEKNPSTEKFLPQKTITRYWEETGLNYSHLDRFISQEVCHSSAERFVGCIFALDSVAKNAKMALVTHEHLWENNEKFGKILKDFEGIYLVEYFEENAKSSHETLPVSEWHKAHREKREREINTLKRIYENRGVLNRFQLIKNELDTRIFSLDSKREAEITATAINLFLQTSEDAHARLQPTQEFSDKKANAEERFFGIGINLQLMGKNFVITKLHEGGPAHSAGLLPLDFITHVDHICLQGLDLEQAIQHIRGAEDSSVLIRVLRKGTPLQLTVVRGPIIVPNVRAKLLQDRDELIGYIKLESFTDDRACNEIATQIEHFKKAGTKGIILDLRENGGGLLHQGVCISGLFVGDKVIVKVKDLNKNFFTDHKHNRAAITDLPMVTLIDAGSASASEIVAGALQDHRRSWIAGARSYGKATVQLGQEIAPHILLWMTVQRFYQPSGRTNQLVGIQPDFPLDPKPDATEEDRFALREADTHINALPALGTNWVQPRPYEVNAIQKCVEKTGSALTSYAARLNDPIPGDYQILMAQDILDCEAKAKVEAAEVQKKYQRFFDMLMKR